MYAKIKEKLSISPQELEEQVVKFWKTFQSSLIVSREHLNTEAKEPILPNQAMYAKSTANAITSQPVSKFLLDISLCRRLTPLFKASHTSL